MHLADAVHPHFAKLVGECTQCSLFFYFSRGDSKCNGILNDETNLSGARESEVACMGTLTANLHLMLNVFYKPTPERYRILCEAKAFPSDQVWNSRGCRGVAPTDDLTDRSYGHGQYAFATQVSARGYDPDDAVIALAPRPGEHILRTEDILDTIERQGSSIALVLFPGVQFYTGQVFPYKEITAAARAKVCFFCSGVSADGRLLIYK